jgi:cytochrome d ubiquinol oxidase subunit I
MVGCGFWFIGLFAFSFWLASTRKLTRYSWYLQAALFSLPLPWIAAELGWVVAEYGRQPWAIEGILPTSLAVSSVTTAQVATSLAGFVLFYSVLAAVDLVLMRKYIRKGPDGLGMWPQA